MKNNLRNYFNIVSLKQTGSILSKRQNYQYNLGKASLGLWLQNEYELVDTDLQYILNYILNNNLFCSSNAKLCKYLIKEKFFHKKYLFVILLLIHSTNYDISKFIDYCIKYIIL